MPTHLPDIIARYIIVTIKQTFRSVLRSFPKSHFRAGLALASTDTRSSSNSSIAAKMADARTVVAEYESNMPLLVPSTSRARRKSNFTQQEVTVLMRMMKKYSKYLSGRITSNEDLIKRRQVWTKVVEAVNSVSADTRTLEEIKSKWKKCKYEVKGEIRVNFHFFCVLNFCKADLFCYDNVATVVPRYLMRITHVKLVINKYFVVRNKFFFEVIFLGGAQQWQKQTYFAYYNRNDFLVSYVKCSNPSQEYYLRDKQEITEYTIRNLKRKL